MIFCLYRISNWIFCTLLPPAEERSFLLHALPLGEERERGEKSIVFPMHSCLRTGDAARLLVRADRFSHSRCNLFPIQLLVYHVISCITSCRGASLLTKVLLLIDTDNTPYRCTRGPAEDNGRVLDELHVEVGVPLVHADLNPAQPPRYRLWSRWRDLCLQDGWWSPDQAVKNLATNYTEKYSAIHHVISII